MSFPRISALFAANAKRRKKATTSKAKKRSRKRSTGAKRKRTNEELRVAHSRADKYENEIRATDGYVETLQAQLRQHGIEPVNAVDYYSKPENWK